MNRNIKKYLRLLWQSVLFWSLAMGFFSIFRYYGIDEEEGIYMIPEYRGYTGTIRALMGFSSIGMLIGIVYATIDLIFDKYTSNKISLVYNLIVRTLFYFITTVIIFTIIMDIFSDIYNLNLDTDRGWWKENKSFWATILYIVMVSFVFSFIKIATEKFGRGVFIKMLLGKYKNPQEEKRIFMFLDLKDSTTIAEKLGHFKYSQFIQDCFYDLNTVVPKHEAEIYQYVGDEAVLSWPYKKGLANNNCVSLFFAFQQKKQSKADYYEEKYGVIPEFKAGLHGGKLMVTEVGVIKKEIAYHGDVINTSARIQAECNNHKVKLLISEELLQDLSINSSLSTTFLGSVLLKGKQKEVNIHTISKNLQPN
ncbi:adenylate/guanylate cyclase domain-containing protein [Aquimarina sp. AD1]|uniref:adenylate/guanylate cyclase domain-containing protein n=1 Tax=Aquimarina TaxID=290174 RepID=UPI0004870FF5|nr:MULTISPECIES: adenylate/guanylate cyclase domain-containing protein [Aquimarina]AXT55379.1 adenylate/guanylate cyclase domain-containing protein [Aquimarina sp. AD1]RKN28705.1 adenylate/guanylate cyclase domain-containing protein [Aquimarina sp. AD1]